MSLYKFLLDRLDLELEGPSRPIVWKAGVDPSDPGLDPTNYKEMQARIKSKSEQVLDSLRPYHTTMFMVITQMAMYSGSIDLTSSEIVESQYMREDEKATLINAKSQLLVLASMYTNVDSSFTIAKPDTGKIDMKPRQVPQTHSKYAEFCKTNFLIDVGLCTGILVARVAFDIYKLYQTAGASGVFFLQQITMANANFLECATATSSSRNNCLKTGTYTYSLAGGCFHVYHKHDGTWSYKLF